MLSNKLYALAEWHDEQAEALRAKPKTYVKVFKGIIEESVRYQRTLATHDVFKNMAAICGHEEAARTLRQAAHWINDATVFVQDGRQPAEHYSRRLTAKEEMAGRLLKDVT